MSTALAAVDHVQLMQGKAQLLGKALNLGLELALLQRRQFVEERKNGNGVNGDHENLQTSSEGPEVVEELAASLLYDAQKPSKNGWGENNSNKIRLDHIHHKELGSLLIEAKLLLEHECVVDAGGERQELVDDHEGEDEDDGMGDLACEPRGRELQEETASP